MSTTPPARLLEKALCLWIGEKVPFFMPDKPAVFVPRQGPDDGSPSLPFHVFAVMDDDKTFEVNPGSGVYQMHVRLVMMSNIDDTLVKDHQTFVRKCYQAIQDQFLLPQGYHDDENQVEEVITITKIVPSGPPVTVEDDEQQDRADAIDMIVACNTRRQSADWPKWHNSTHPVDSGDEVY